MTKMCFKCWKKREDKDFLVGNDCCYKCVYELKLQNRVKEQKNNKCKICNKEIIRSDYYKKKPRRSFCSEECAKIGHNKIVSGYWTRKLLRPV